MKVFVASLAAVAALLVAGTAAAYMTAPPAGTWVSLTPCFTQGSVTVQQGQYLRVGWGTVSQQQALDFLAAQNFTLTADRPNVAGLDYTLASWGTGNTDSWTLPRRVTVGGRPIYQTTAFVQVNIPAGEYVLATWGTIYSPATSVNRAVFDGETVTKKGENWYPIYASCLLIVT